MKHIPSKDNIAKNIIFLDVLKKAAKRFSEKKIPIITIKGVAFLGKEYPQLDRHLGDIDIVVRKKDFEISKEIMLSLGGERVVFATEKNRPFTSQQEYYEQTYLFIERNVRVQIDVHSAFEREIAFPLDYEKIFHDKIPHPLNDLADLGIYTLSPEHHLIQLAIHQMHHGYDEDVRNYYDAQRILQINTINVTSFLNDIESWRLQSIVYFFLLRGKSLGIVDNADILLSLCSPSITRRKITSIFLDPAKNDPFVLSLSQRLKQVLLYSLFCENVRIAIEFPVFYGYLRLKDEMYKLKEKYLKP